MEPKTISDLYRIGTVASLTGISVERLRAWERRYDFSPAHKTGKTRFYSRTQLDRLKLIKHLIDQGQPISSLASLDHAQLVNRIEVENAPNYRVDVLQRPTVGLIGPNLLMLEQQAQKLTDKRLDVVSRWANMQAFESEQLGAVEPDLVIVQLPVLSSQPIDIISNVFEKARVIVVYQFATSKTLSALTESGLAALKWPLSWSELEHVSIAEIGTRGLICGATPRRYSDEELIAMAAETDDPSNCTQYLIEAINQLNAFTAYAHDSALALSDGAAHKQLQNDASFARHNLEGALEDFVVRVSGG